MRGVGPGPLRATAVVALVFAVGLRDMLVLSVNLRVL